MLYFSEKMPLQWHFEPHLNADFERLQVEQRQFTRRVLPALFQRLGIDAVISSASHYREDFEMGCVAEELGFPYVVLQRENIVGPVPAHRRRYIERLSRQGKFRGRHIIVHDEETRAAFVDSGFAQEGQVTALGVMRMDALAQRIAQATHSRCAARPRVTFFSFAHGTSLLSAFGFNAFAPQRDQGFVRLFTDSHVAFARLAAARQDVDFVIRPKWRGGWQTEIERALAGAGLAMQHIPNLTLDAESDAHDVIFAQTLCAALARPRFSRPAWQAGRS